MVTQPPVSRTLGVPGRQPVPVYSFRALVIGSGAAGLNCAEHLHELGVTDVAIVTAGLGTGASANSGSDKQTYYKLGICGDIPDSPLEMAQALFAGGMCHGDLAYIEALGSAPEFFHLVRNGVPFPHDRYGAYVGYKTDYDPRRRATSAGPKTSWLMVEKALVNVRRQGTPIFDHHEVIRLLTAGEGDRRRVIGALALDTQRLNEPDRGLVAFQAEDVVLATGGPGELYRDSVYPRGQFGSHGLALAIGAAANNLTESQFGLASVGFRWNLSGSYQQVIPCYFSTDAAGGDVRYFLNSFYSSMAAEATSIFLKGYQWPFHAEGLAGGGSSVIDVTVHLQRQAGRRCYLDFTRNPVADEGLEEFALERLGDEARQYLERCGCTQATPLERLQHLNPESIALFAEAGVDLRQPLEVAVCAQHCNGGLSANLWWETTVPHLFAIGEVAGTHGVRPGGCALNAGQVGGLRAAQYIAHGRRRTSLDQEAFAAGAAEQVAAEWERLRRLAGSAGGAERAGDGAPALQDGAEGARDGGRALQDDHSTDRLRQPVLPDEPEGASSPGLHSDVLREVQERMTVHAAHLRSVAGAREALAGARALWERVQREGLRLEAGAAELPQAIRVEHLVLTHLCFLEALAALLERGGGSRGGYAVLDDAGDRHMVTRRGVELPHRGENAALRQEVLEVRVTDDGRIDVQGVPVRPLPEDDPWFETTWREFQTGAVFADASDR